MAAADTDRNAAPAEAAPKKKGKLIPIVGAAVLLAAIGGGSYFLGHRAPSADATAEAAPAKGEKAKAEKSEKGEKGKDAKVAAKGGGEPIYLALDPPFVVNFQDEAALRFLQVGVQVMAKDQAALDAVKAAEPVVRNALVMLFSSQSYTTLSTREGKEKLRADALAELQKIVAQRPGKSGLEEVYFTSFVMQ